MSERKPRNQGLDARNKDQRKTRRREPAGSPTQYFRVRALADLTELALARSDLRAPHARVLRRRARRFTPAGFSLVFVAGVEPLIAWLSFRHSLARFDAAGRVKREAHRCSKRL